MIGLTANEFEASIWFFFRPIRAEGKEDGTERWPTFKVFFVARSSLLLPGQFLDEDKSGRTPLGHYIYYPCSVTRIAIG